MKLNEIIFKLKHGGIGVFPTDTLYGLVGSALNKKTVERIYKARKRNPKKPFIILIASEHDLARFSIRTKPQIKTFLQKLWPGPVSIIFDCPSKKLEFLHRGTNSLAFRVPQSTFLRQVLKKIGPLVAPSANVEGEPPAQTIQGAKNYFGDAIDFYYGNRRKKGAPSTLIKLLR